MANFPTIETTTEAVEGSGAYPGGSPIDDAVFSLRITGKVAFRKRIVVPNGSNPITLPVSPVHGLFIRNLDVTNSVEIFWTPTGQGNIAPIVLPPGSFIAFGNIRPDRPAEAGITGFVGITALNVTALTTLPCAVEIILVG